MHIGTAIAISLAPLLLAHSCEAQQFIYDDVLVHGYVKHLEDDRGMAGAWVVVQRDGVKVGQLVTDSAGAYETYLLYDHVYTLWYMMGGMVTKHIVIDLNNVPADQRSGGHGMTVDVRLFKAMPCMDLAVLEEPIGLARYSPLDSTIAWDMDHVERMRSRFSKAMHEVDSLKAAGGCR